MKFKKIFLIIILIANVINLNKVIENETNNKIKKDILLYGENKTIYEISSACSTIILSGLGDKSFLITTIMATKYNKLLVFLAGSLSLILMSYLSIQMGIVMPNYIPTYSIDIIAVAIFITAGIQMILNGLSTDNVRQGSLKEAKDILKSDLITNKPTWKQSIIAFIQVFFVVFTSELGDKSQVSTIYLSSNYDSTVLFYSVSMANIILTIIAVFGGQIVAAKLSESSLNTLAGAIFLIFGMITLCLTFVNDYPKINTSAHNYFNRLTGVVGQDIMIDKGLINKNFLK
jgi:putative Ca2+/H+ antiporter (TMEM165/GDT1 family)